MELNSPYANFGVWLHPCYEFGDALKKYVNNELWKVKKGVVAGPWQFGEHVEGHPISYEPVKPNYNQKITAFDYKKQRQLEDPKPVDSKKRPLAWLDSAFDDAE